MRAIPGRIVGHWDIHCRPVWLGSAVRQRVHSIGMEIFIISFIVILIAVVGMAVGVLLRGPRHCLKGSCGGIANTPGMEGSCACGRKDSSGNGEENETGRAS
uniref:Uncharacterized protein n=1 Tax=Candidatus Kentrum sp. DK TaxID=2126562 RepID=A0A450S5T8_9GAMM|nr:MAG: hypothetical protein BECKDK2373B_GA0170837_101622 [Candidatus Kentron sp. DK]